MDLIPIYSVPMWQGSYPEFRDHKKLFLDVVKKYKEENDKSEFRSSINGYQSPQTLHQVEELRPLFEYICQLGFKAVADLEFVDCDNLKLPVNSDNLISQLTNLRDNESELT